MMILIISFLLMVMDHSFERVSLLRSAIGTLLTPVQWVSDLPAAFLNWGGSTIKTREQLLDENDALQAQQRSLEITGRALETQVAALLASRRMAADAVRLL